MWIEIYVCVIVNSHLFTIKSPSLDDEFTQLPIRKPIRDFNGDILSFVLRVFTSCEAWGQTNIFLFGDTAERTDVIVSRHQSAVRQLCVSGHYLEVWVGADKTMAGESDCERRVDGGRDSYLDDQSRPPASILWPRSPLTRRWRECVHLSVLQDKTGVVVCVN